MARPPAVSGEENVLTSRGRGRRGGPLLSEEDAGNTHQQRNRKEFRKKFSESAAELTPAEEQKLDLNRTFVKPEEVRFLQFYSFFTRSDVCWVIFGICISLLEAFATVLLPVLVFVAPRIALLKSPFPWLDHRSPREIFSQWRSYWSIFGLLASAMIVSSFFRMLILTCIREKIVLATKRAYYKAVLSTDMAWFDRENPLSVSASLWQDVIRVSEVHNKAPMLVIGVMKVVFLFVVLMLLQWRVALVGFVAISLMVLSISVMVQGRMSAEGSKDTAYREADGVAEELFGHTGSG